MADVLQRVTEPRLMDVLLQESYDYKRPRRGDIRRGVVLSVGPDGAVLDLGLKRDGIASAADLQRLGQDTAASIQVGDGVSAFILKPEGRDGNIQVSLYRARREQGWLEAQELLDRGEIWEGEVTDYNRGGLVVPSVKRERTLPLRVILLKRSCQANSLWKSLPPSVGVPGPVSLKKNSFDRTKLLKEEEN